MRLHAFLQPQCYNENSLQWHKKCYPLSIEKLFKTVKFQKIVDIVRFLFITFALYTPTNNKLCPFFIYVLP